MYIHFEGCILAYSSRISWYNYMRVDIPPRMTSTHVRCMFLVHMHVYMAGKCHRRCFHHGNGETGLALHAIEGPVAGQIFFVGAGVTGGRHNASNGIVLSENYVCFASLEAVSLMFHTDVEGKRTGKGPFTPYFSRRLGVTWVEI